MGNTPFITVRASRPLSEIEFCAWVAQAAPGLCCAKRVKSELPLSPDTLILRAR